MGRCEPMRNSVAYTSRLCEVQKECSQGTGGCVRNALAPIDFGCDHLSLKPPPDNEGSADFGIKFV